MTTPRGRASGLRRIGLVGHQSARQDRAASTTPHQSIAVNGFASVWVHSIAIGTATCGLIVGGKRLLERRGLDRSWWFIALIPAATLVGTYAGSVIARTLMGIPDPLTSALPTGPTQRASLIAAVIASPVLAWFFVARERMAALRAAAAQEAQRLAAAPRETSQRSSRCCRRRSSRTCSSTRSRTCAR